MQKDGFKAVAKPIPPDNAEGNGDDDEEVSDDGDKPPPAKKCCFHGKDNFVCTAVSDLRECLGMNGCTKGTTDARICKKNDGKPCYFHHTCYMKFYTELKKKVLHDDEECNFCPSCKEPKFGRKARTA